MTRKKRDARGQSEHPGAKSVLDLMQTALGDKPADLVIKNGKILNVYTGEILNGWSVSVTGERIAALGENLEFSVGEKTLVIDAEGKTVIPGLIDGHAHLGWLFCVSEFLKTAMKGGTTSLVTETMELFPVGGVDSVMEFIASLENQPIKIFATAPAMVSISKSARGIPKSALKKLLLHPDVVGLGESYWQGVLQEPQLFQEAFAQTQRLGKIIEGHSAGAKGKKLNAYAALGVSSCHEPITVEEVLERLRLGFWVMIREGSIRQDLEAISSIKDRGIDLRRLVLVTDGITPKDLLEKGYMEYVVQKAIHCGFDPIVAIQMATLNVAEHFHLDHFIGGIAPGRAADILIIPDIKTIRPEVVISKGRIILQNFKMRSLPRPHAFSKESFQSVQLKHKITSDDFSVSAQSAKGYAKVRIIHQVTDLVTKELEETLRVIDGDIQKDLARDIIKVAAIDRTKHSDKMFVGFIKGFQMKSGAFASSAAWDTSDIVVVGADESDMASAVNHIWKLQGGAVICVRGKIKAELPLPIFGLISRMPMKSLNRKLSHLSRAASAIGTPFQDPLLTLVTLTGAAIPYLRICEEGLVNLIDGKRRELVIKME